MEQHEIAVSTANRVRTLTLNRPDRLNAWTQRMEDALRREIAAAEADPDVRAIVITGAGRAFCAGADMDILEAGAKEGAAGVNSSGATRTRAEEAGIECNYGRRFSYLLKVPKPIFAAINGPVAGIGLCMALFCDFRYMAEGQKLTTAFARRGLIAEHGISWMLPRLIGPAAALDLLMSARTLLTAEAAALGLVRQLPGDGFLAQVKSIATDLVHGASPRSIGVIKRQVYDSLFQDLNAAWERADEEMHMSFASEDFREGVAHFLEKRAPAFTGR